MFFFPTSSLVSVCLPSSLSTFSPVLAVGHGGFETTGGRFSHDVVSVISRRQSSFASKISNLISRSEACFVLGPDLLSSPTFSLEAGTTVSWRLNYRPSGLNRRVPLQVSPAMFYSYCQQNLFAREETSGSLLSDESRSYTSVLAGTLSQSGAAIVFLYRPPPLTVSRRQCCKVRSRLSSIDGVLGNEANPSSLILLLGLDGPLSVGYAWALVVSALVELGLYWYHHFNCCWVSELGTEFRVPELLDFPASRSYFMQPHQSCLSMNYAYVLTSLLTIRSTVRESLSSMPLQRATFPGRVLLDQWSSSRLENFQTAFQRIFDGFLKAVSIWSTFGNCTTIHIAILDHVERVISMVFEELSLSFVLNVVFPFPSLGWMPSICVVELCNQTL